MSIHNNEHARCTVGLLAWAAKAAYGVKLLNKINEKEYPAPFMAFKAHGYEPAASISPKPNGGTGITPLAALCLEPKDPEAPIVIAFRGTKMKSDFRADIRLGVTGNVGKAFRDAAFAFYQDIQRKNPGREIVLTGHSLGGHLAQYVGTRAYHEQQNNPEFLAQSLVSVRTFNTAPISTKCGVVFEKNPDLTSQFVNYRLSHDVISDLPIQKYYGSTFVFPYKKGIWDSHKMSNIIVGLPPDILNQRVGHSHNVDKMHCALIEMTNGLLYSYQCRIEGQYFSRYRAGFRNLKQMQQALPGVLEEIEQGKYDAAVLKLDSLKGKLHGKMSTHIIDVLIRNTVGVKVARQMAGAEQSNVASKPNDIDTHVLSNIDEASLYRIM